MASNHHGLAVRKIKRYGWVPDRPDHNDRLYSPSASRLRTLPSSADLRPECPLVYDQGELGSCTANAIAAALQFDRMKQATADETTPSRLFIYYLERMIEGTVAEDAGAMIRDGMKACARVGACDESLWPYDTAKFADKPPQSAFDAAADLKATNYSRVVVGHATGLAQLKAAIADGYPVVFGFTVYASFESNEVARTGVVPIPSHREEVLGGHAVVAVGYDDAKQWAVVRNSWGTGWGDGGYCYFPYSYLMTGSDFWTIKAVSDQSAT